ncbi:MAG: helix-turn-helix domain-containing protein [Gemmataceae bacterium]
MESPYLNAEESAAYLRKTLHGLYGLVKRGRLSPLPGSPGRLLFTREVLDHFLASKPRR